MYLWLFTSLNCVLTQEFDDLDIFCLSIATHGLYCDLKKFSIPPSSKVTNDTMWGPSDKNILYLLHSQIETKV